MKTYDVNGNKYKLVYDEKAGSCTNCIANHNNNLCGELNCYCDSLHSFQIYDDTSISKTYIVQWAIDIEASTPEEAAKEAWNIMKEPSNEASIIDVFIGDDKIADFDMNYLEYGEDENAKDN